MRYSIESILPRLAKSPLFRGCTKDDIRTLSCLLGGDVEKYGPGTSIQPGGRLAIVLSGVVAFVREDLWGGRGVVERLGPGELIESVPQEYQIVSQTGCSVFFLSAPDHAGVRGGDVLTQNLSALRWEREKRLLEKADILSHRSVRGRILTYLSYESQRQGKLSVQLSMNRPELANYLCTERAVLSAELSALQRDGLLSLKGERVALNPDTWRQRTVV